MSSAADAKVDIPLSYLRPCCHRFRDELIIHSFLERNSKTKEKRRWHTKLRISPKMVHSFDEKIQFRSAGETEWPDGRDDRSFRFCRIHLIVMRWMLAEFRLRRRCNSIKISTQMTSKCPAFRPEASGIGAIFSSGIKVEFDEKSFRVDAATNERSTIKRDTPQPVPFRPEACDFRERDCRYFSLFFSSLAFFCRLRILTSTQVAPDRQWRHLRLFSFENFRQIFFFKRKASADTTFRHSGFRSARKRFHLQTNQL